MPRLLIFCDDFPHDMASGLHLRILNLCEQLALKNDCFLVCTAPPDAQSENIKNGPFIETRFIPQRGAEKKSLARHFRLSNARFIETSSPKYFREISDELRKVSAAWNVDAVISFAPTLAELGLTLDLPRVIDIPDCSSLTMQRVLANRMRDLPLAGNIGLRLQKHRQLGRERRMLNGYDATTTISQPDKLALLASSGVSSERVTVIPNGVSSDFFAGDSSQEKEPRSIVFWGNLDFPPNWTAVRYFYDEIFLPYLVAKDVHWYVVGRGTDPKLDEIGEHPNIHIAGFQEDLVEYVGHKVVTVNPMIEGSGLKNKVLESFAMGLPVVTTSLGVEAIGGNDGEHFLVADEPQEFATCILKLLDNSASRDLISTSARELARSHFSWPAIGDRFQEVIKSTVSPPDGAARS